jgi:hypothetical protein
MSRTIKIDGVCVPIVYEYCPICNGKGYTFLDDAIECVCTDEDYNSSEEKES